MKKDFIDYIRNEFDFSQDEINNFENACSMPLKKSIRVNTNKISVENFKKLVWEKWWKLTDTCLWKNTFYIDRAEDLDIALWNTVEHLNGFFYIQELAASSSPFYMSGDKVDKNEYLILDMSASPWWKTTQLSEYYPNSIIIANEINKQRLKWLFVNLDRMSSSNVLVTNYDWRFFREYLEKFDKVLLDAPCSWEWTAYKTDDSLKYWNIKNIKSIAKLQLSLIDSALKTLKVWWELVYSTCTLNRIENEWVIDLVMQRYADCLEIVPLFTKSEIISEWEKKNFVRNWPHINGTWWFFVAKIKKIKSFDIENPKEINSRDMFFWKDLEKNNKYIKQKDVVQNYEKLSSKDMKMILKFIEDNFSYSLKEKKFFRYKDEIFIFDQNIDFLWKDLFFYKTWIKIWELKKGIFVPNFNLWIIEKFEKNSFSIWVIDFNKLHKWEDVFVDKVDWYYQIIVGESVAWIVIIKNKKMKFCFN